MSAKAEMTKFIRDLKKTGYQVSLTGSRHWMIKDRQGRFVTTAPSTPGAYSGHANLRAAIKRHERQYPQERSTT